MTHILDDFRVPQKKKNIWWHRGNCPYTARSYETLWRHTVEVEVLGNSLAHENDAYLNISCSVCHFDLMGKYVK